jgi:hypothetical protein
MKRPLLIELAWLLVAVILTYILAVMLFGWRFSSRTIDINQSDTYFVVSAEIVLIPIFSLVCFLLFFFKEINRHFSKKIPSIITIASGILLITMLTITTKFLPVIGGWTMYPPLSALGGDDDSNNYSTRLHYGFDQHLNSLANVIIIEQAIVALMTAYVAYRLGVAKIKKV